jgi:mannitol/fructose-specific phosphotransferase system IIA component (Ntr-type)
VRLAEVLDPSLVLLDIQHTRRTAAIHEVARQLDGHPGLLDYAAFYQELLARERLDPTFIGHESALPHARSEHARSTLLAVGRSREGVWFENCNQQVKLVFVLAVPKSRPADYLALVSTLCRLLKEGTLRTALLEAPSATEFVRLLSVAEEGAPASR